MRLTTKTLVTALASLCLGLSQAQTVSIVYTTDIHGSIFSEDLVRDTIRAYNMVKAHTFVESVRDTSKNVILLDNGDFLQGAPTVYYYNNVDTAGVNVMARVFNFMKYDAVCVGNHDIEAQHRVFDKVRSQMECPLISANIVNTATGKPYFQPYTIIERAGKRIAVIGLTTPHIPHWLPEHYWSGMEFEDMVESAQHWVKRVRETEKPDAVIGLFHAGFDYNYNGQSADDHKNENASVLVAERVDGFDAILIGHDHKLYNKEVTSPSGRKVPVLDAGSHVRNVGLLTLTFDKSGESPKCKAKLISTASQAPSEKFEKTFRPQIMAVKAYTRKVIGKLDEDLYAYESLMGNSGFVDIAHRTMLKHTGADISMCSPLLINTMLPKGDVTVGRMFSLYRYENTLCVLRMTGKEVKNYLEFSYDQWIQDPKKNGTILKTYRPGRLKASYYSLDSAAGIIYTVDVTKPMGQRVRIVSMADGSKFDLKKSYKVAVNSYRANGGGGLLEQGAGLDYKQRKARTIKAIDKDLRGLMIADFEEAYLKGEAINSKSLGNWKFVPEKLVEEAMSKEIEAFK